MYEYGCKVKRVVDGDTIDITIDLGFKIFYDTRVRMYGIDTPESRTRDKDEKARGLLAKKFLQKKVKTGKSFKIQTQKDSSGKYGRVIGILIIDDININELIVIEHLGVKYFGQSKEDIEAEHLKNKKILLDKGLYEAL